jgi:YbbR domain-containing protein
VKLSPNIPFMFFSVVISLMLWLIVFAQDLPKNDSITLRVAFPNLDTQEWYVDQNHTPVDVSLKFSGTAEDLEKIRYAKPTIDVDISNPREGTYRYPAELNPNGYKDQLINKAILVQVTLEKVITKTVPVKVKQEGSLSDSNLTVTPVPAKDIARVTGPRSMIDQVTNCQAWFNLSDVDPLKPVPLSAPLVAMNDAGTPFREVRIDPVTIAIASNVSAAPVTKLVLVVPKVVGRPASGYLPKDYTWEPKTVELTGDPQILARTTTVETDPVDVSGLTGDRTFRTRLRIPSGLQSTHGRRVSVTYWVTPDPSLRSGAGVPSKPPADTFPSTVPPLNGAKGGGP